MKTYSKLITLPTFEERFNYLLIGGEVAADTFGYNRYLNQDFYHSPEWRRFRRDMIIRDHVLFLTTGGLFFKSSAYKY